MDQRTDQHAQALGVGQGTVGTRWEQSPTWNLSLEKRNQAFQNLLTKIEKANQIYAAAPTCSPHD